MIALFASVQTAEDLAPVHWSQVLVAVAFMFILSALLAGPVLLSLWRDGHEARQRRAAWLDINRARQAHPAVRAHRAVTRQRLEKRR